MQLSRAAAAPAEPAAPPSPAPAPAPSGPLPHSATDGALAGGEGGPGRRVEPPSTPLPAASSPRPGAGMDGPGAGAVVVRVGIPDLQQTVSACPAAAAPRSPPPGRPPPCAPSWARGTPGPRLLTPPPPPPRGPSLAPRGAGPGEAPPLGRAGPRRWQWRQTGRWAPESRIPAGSPGRGALRGRAHAPAPPQKCLRLDPAAPVWAAKQRVLCALNHSLQDALNYGLFQPPSRGRAGKFLDEERLLQDYPPNLDTPLPYLEVSGGRARPGREEGARGATTGLRGVSHGSCASGAFVCGSAGSDVNCVCGACSEPWCVCV